MRQDCPVALLESEAVVGTPTVDDRVDVDGHALRMTIGLAHGTLRVHVNEDLTVVGAQVDNQQKAPIFTKVDELQDFADVKVDPLSIAGHAIFLGLLPVVGVTAGSTIIEQKTFVNQKRPSRVFIFL